jgi:hypothetical protein
MQKYKPEPEPGERPYQTAEVQVLNPRCRVPVSLIIDDSTCLVNLAHFCIPQFAEVFPNRYRQDWSRLPREIPDAFVREFGEWCHAHGVKGKYSIVPNPACVGWLDRDLPGWTKKALENSLALVRDFLTPDWDIHPEMLTHTWVINTRTGRPYEERSERFMENWEWTTGRSTDEIADYLSYGLRILRNVGLPCEGITTPGGFGNNALPELSRATLESCRDVFATEIPHYFRHVFTDPDTSVAPRVEYASGPEGADPRCVVSLIGCTDDWFGGWDGLSPGSADLFITADGRGGRLPQVIEREEPALLVCHWPGIYYNGEKVGFHIFQEVVRRLQAHYGSGLVWMKLSQIARYWAARTLTKIERSATEEGAGEGAGIVLYAPFATPDFTIDIDTTEMQLPEEVGSVTLRTDGAPQPLRRVETVGELTGGTWCRLGTRHIFVCFDLPRGKSLLSVR